MHIHFNSYVFKCGCNYFEEKGDGLVELCLKIGSVIFFFVGVEIRKSVFLTEVLTVSWFYKGLLMEIIAANILHSSLILDRTGPSKAERGAEATN